MHAGKNLVNELVEEYKYIKISKTEWKFVNFKNFRNVLENFKKFWANFRKLRKNFRKFKKFKEMFKFLKILNNKWKGISRHPNGGVRPFVPSLT